MENALAAFWANWAEPVFWVALTVGVFRLALGLSRRAGGAPWANPVMVSVLVVSLIVIGLHADYDRYFRGAWVIHALLGPATVALALPLWDNRARIRRALVPMAVALLVGSVVAMGSALAIGWALGLRGAVWVSLAPKSATAPVAIGIAEKIGAIPSLTAVMVILTGILGAVIAIPMLQFCGVRDRRAQGFATGVAAHGIGTAEALRVDETAGAFSGIAMGLNALLTSILAPIAVQLLVFGG